MPLTEAAAPRRQGKTNMSGRKCREAELALLVKAVKMVDQRAQWGQANIEED